MAAHIASVEWATALGGEGCGFGVLLFGGVGGAAGAGEDIQAEVAAAFDPFVVLFGQDGADETDEAARSGKMPTTSVRRRISLFNRSCGLLLRYPR
jgi:hypothetical protein